MGQAATLAPRLLTRHQAAERCGLTESGFSTWVVRKLVPGPLPGTKRWDIKALDLALDRLSGIAPEPMQALVDEIDGEGQDAVRRRYADWKARREGRA